MHRRLLALFLCLGITTTGHAEDWPQFRGPTQQGIYIGKLPTEWGPERNVAWKVAIPGKGWSSPIIVGGRVYLTTAVPVAGTMNDQSLRSMCLDAATGKIVWNTEIFTQDGATAPAIHSKNSHASPTPLIDGKQLFVHFGHQGTACLDLDGKVLWRNREQKYKPVHGNGGSPVVVGKSLIFSCDGSDQQYVIALDRDTGKPLWRTDRNLNAGRGFSFSTPLVIEVAGKKQVVSSGSGGVISYDPATGKEIWKATYPVGFSVVPRPIFGQGMVFVCTGFGTPKMLAIKVDGMGDVTQSHVVWETAKNVPHEPAPLLVDDEIYMTSNQGLVTCLDAKTGALHWQERIPGPCTSSPLAADGKVYFPNDAGACTILEASKQFKMLGRNELKEKMQASFAAANGALYIRTLEHLYRIGAK